MSSSSVYRKQIQDSVLNHIATTTPSHSAYLRHVVTSSSRLRMCLPSNCVHSRIRILILYERFIPCVLHPLPILYWISLPSNCFWDSRPISYDVMSFCGFPWLPVSSSSVDSNAVLSHLFLSTLSTWRPRHLIVTALWEVAPCRLLHFVCDAVLSSKYLPMFREKVLF
jgi:hypothetical protein